MMGIKHKPRVNMYLSNDTVVCTQIFGQLIVRDRIFLYLDFYNLMTTVTTMQMTQIKTDCTELKKLQT